MSSVWGQQGHLLRHKKRALNGVRRTLVSVGNLWGTWTTLNKFRHWQELLVTQLRLDTCRRQGPWSAGGVSFHPERSLSWAREQRRQICSGFSFVQKHWKDVIIKKWDDRQKPLRFLNMLFRPDITWGPCTVVGGPFSLFHIFQCPHSRPSQPKVKSHAQGIS